MQGVTRISKRRWDALNEERSALIDKDIDGELSECEQQRLSELQAIAGEYIDSMPCNRAFGLFLDQMEEKLGLSSHPGEVESD